MHSGTFAGNRSNIYLLFAVLTLTVFCSGCGRSDEEASGIKWGADMDVALKEAKETDRIVMVDFMATWCPPCRAMEDSTFCRPEVIEKAKMFVMVRIDVDKQKDVAVKYGGNARKYGGIGIPNILFMTGGEEKIKHIVGYHGPDNLIMVMDSVLARNALDEE